MMRNRERNGRQRRHPALCSTLLIIGLGACSNSMGPQGEQLQLNRALWDRQQIADYRYHFQRLCFCPPEVTDPVIIEVSGSEVLTVTRLDGNVPFGAPEDYPTIIDLFDEIAAAIDADAAVVDVTYDPTLGYPTVANIDFSLNVIDEEMSLRASSLEVFDPIRAGLSGFRR